MGCQHNDESGKVDGHLHEQAGYSLRWEQSCTREQKM
jgi:hypothetical protein